MSTVSISGDEVNELSVEMKRLFLEKMIIDVFSQSYNSFLVFSSSDISNLFPNRKDLSYRRTF